MSSLANSLNMAESYLAYFADDIAFDTANDHHIYKGLSTDRKHEYLKNEIVKMKGEIINCNVEIVMFGSKFDGM